MSYHHLNIFERTRIEVLSTLGYSTRQISKELNRHHSTIARELKRNTNNQYIAEQADLLANERRFKVKIPSTKTAELIILIQTYLNLTWSPEQIANTVLKGKVSFKTIYNWLYDGTLQAGDLSCLRQKGK